MHPTLVHIRALLQTAYKRLDNARADIYRYSEALRASEGRDNVQECLDMLTAATERREAALHDSECLAVVATLLERDSHFGGAYLIAAERDAQRMKYSAEHDAEHDDGELAYRAAELAVGSTITLEVRGLTPDGWGLVSKHEQLELGADGGSWLELDGAQEGQRARIGNAIPPHAAQAIGVEVLEALDAATTGAYRLFTGGLWVAPRLAA